MRGGEPCLPMPPSCFCFLEFYSLQKIFSKHIYLLLNLQREKPMKFPAEILEQFTLQIVSTLSITTWDRESELSKWTFWKSKVESPESVIHSPSRGFSGWWWCSHSWQSSVLILCELWYLITVNLMIMSFFVWNSEITTDKI